MNRSKHVLLPSHGTVGAQAAESVAIELCAEDAKIHHLVVVPDLWKGMMGDDWLNNGVTRDRYARYLETELGREVEEHCERVRSKAKEKGVHYSCEIVLGKPDECLIEACMETDYDLVVMGSPRPKGTPGLRSRMATKSLTQALSSPLLTVPYPDG